MTIQWFDTHVHLEEEALFPTRAEVVRRAAEVGVTRMITVGSTVASSRQSIAIAAERENVWASVGIQPNYSAEVAPGAWEEIGRLVKEPKVVAVGETGLDRHWDFAPLAIQQDYFERHLTLSRQCGLPVIIHMRDCQQETLEMLEAARREGPLRGVMHSFSGTTEGAERCIELGLYISFAGMVTFKSAGALLDTAASIPEDRLLIETDAPYLSPHPYRGKYPNEPARLIYTAACIARRREVDPAHLAAATTANAQRLFGIET